MKFIELKTRNGTAFMFDIDSGWEIYDQGDKPADWTNYKQARNLDCGNTYNELRPKLMDNKP